MPVYARPAFFWWWFHFDAHAPPVFVEGAFIASSGGLDPVCARAWLNQAYHMT